MKNFKNLQIILTLFIALFLFNSCSKKEDVTPAPELTIIGKWQVIVTKLLQDGKVVSEYKGTPNDYAEITTNDFIDNIEGPRTVYKYKVIEKNKKITVFGYGTNGSDEVLEIRNLSNTTMTFYQEKVINNSKFIFYVDFKK
jgi:hypothetical protein